jgi:hypothetical protein
MAARKREQLNGIVVLVVMLILDDDAIGTSIVPWSFSGS